MASQMLSTLFVTLSLLSQALGAAVPGRTASLLPYAPFKSRCPSGSLVRRASGLSSSESKYVSTRKPFARAALESWLASVDADFSTENLPSVALASSGGGLRALLVGAGVIQALDDRDGILGTSGLYQGLVYQSGLSGGAWLLSSLAGNDWPTVSSLKSSLWETAFENSLADPGGLAVLGDDAAITNDLIAKHAAGFHTTLTDPWGRLLAYQLLLGPDGGVADRLSGVTANSRYILHEVPYPIITSIQVAANQCTPAIGNPQFELHPYEFGSWDSGIAAFTQTSFLGTDLTGGKPTTRGECVQNYDNLGYVLGTSSNIFSEVCLSVAALPNITVQPIAAIVGLLEKVQNITFADEFAVYPNPFRGFAASPAVSALTELSLVDGGLSSQNDPIWPFIQPARAGHVDVLIVSDNSADTADNFPDGSEIYNTYVRANATGLTRMPAIPPAGTFVAEGLNKRATFFGCNDAAALTIVFLPNVNYTFPSNQPTLRLQYSKNDTDAMIANGVLVGTQNGDSCWPTCLGCAISKKTGEPLPEACQACFEKYCYN